MATKKKLLAENPLFKGLGDADTIEEQETAAATTGQGEKVVKIKYVDAQGKPVDKDGNPIKPKMGRPRKEGLVRDNSAQEGLAPDCTRASFILKVEALKFVRDYAYTRRVSIKDALTEIIEHFEQDYKSDPKNELLEDPKGKK